MTELYVNPLKLTVEKRHAEDEVFTHFYYLWNQQSIIKHGLRMSTDGNLGTAENPEGTGLYCVRAEDEDAVQRAENFMEEYANFHKVADLLGCESSRDLPDDLEREDYMSSTVFRYTGPYWICTSEDEAENGYCLIPSAISKESLSHHTAWDFLCRGLSKEDI